MVRPQIKVLRKHVHSVASLCRGIARAVVGRALHGRGVLLRAWQVWQQPRSFRYEDLNSRSVAIAVLRGCCCSTNWLLLWYRLVAVVVQIGCCCSSDLTKYTTRKRIFLFFLPESHRIPRTGRNAKLVSSQPARATRPPTQPDRAGSGLRFLA